MFDKYNYDVTMKIKGLNKYYSIEIEKENKKVFITLKDALSKEICVGISDKNWEKIKREL